MCTPELQLATHGKASGWPQAPCLLTPAPQASNNGVAAAGSSRSEPAQQQLVS